MSNHNEKEQIEKQRAIEMYNAIVSIEVLTKPRLRALQPKFVNHKCEKTCLGYRVSADMIF